MQVSLIGSICALCGGLWLMTPQEGCESVSEKFLYGGFCLDRLEKVYMGLFLMGTASGSNSVVMA